VIRFGIIGGLGAFASVRLYDLINRIAVETAKEEIEDSSFPDITIRQIPFRSTDRFGRVNKELFDQEIGEGLDSLVASGVTHVSFACNTLNGLFEEAVNRNGKLAFVSTVEETIKGINVEGKTNPLAVLTSRNAVNLGIYRNRSILRPIIEPQQQLVDELIYASMKGKHYEAKDIFSTVVELIREQEPTADILLGCTELSVYNEFSFCNKKYDSMQFTAEKIVRIHHENP
jgi:aspartate/glutamate racemase